MGQYLRRPIGSCGRPENWTWTKRSSSARRSISRTAASGYSNGTIMEARSRGSGSSHSATCQSFTAVARAASSSGFIWRPAGVSGINIACATRDGSRKKEREKERSQELGQLGAHNSEHVEAEHAV